MRPHKHQTGLSIIEFMVGIAVGLFIVGGAAKLFVDYIVGNRRMLLETRVNQDLRAAADLVARDLRRAGYWNNATMAAWPTATSGVGNPYHASPHFSDPSASTVSITYAYARDNNNSVDDFEKVGFRLSNGVLQIKDGEVGGVANWQSLTDPNTVTVTQFTITPATPALQIDLTEYCECLKRVSPPPCTVAAIAASGPPLLKIPKYTIALTGRSVTDAAVVRTVSETVRVRNEVPSGSCQP